MVDFWCHTDYKTMRASMKEITWGSEGNGWCSSISSPSSSTSEQPHPKKVKRKGKVKTGMKQPNGTLSQVTISTLMHATEKNFKFNWTSDVIWQQQMIYQKCVQHNRSEGAGSRAYPCHPRLSALVNEPAVEKKEHSFNWLCKPTYSVTCKLEKPTLAQETKMSEPFTKFISASSQVEQRVGSVPP